MTKRKKWDGSKLDTAELLAEAAEALDSVDSHYCECDEVGAPCFNCLRSALLTRRAYIIAEKYGAKP